MLNGLKKIERKKFSDPEEVFLSVAGRSSIAMLMDDKINKVTKFIYKLFNYNTII